MSYKYLSLIVPAYKQEKTIYKDLKKLNSNLQNLPMRYEIVVVVDGIEDGTEKEVQRLKNPRVRIISYEKNKGKGFAVKKGVLSAKGDIVGFMDAGSDLDPSAISLMVNYMELRNADIVVGSKLHPDSIVNYPLYRKILSLTYRIIVSFLFNLKVKDTQAGVKFFKSEVAKEVFKRIVVKKFAFDVEVLVVARHLGYKKIIEAPIKLDFNLGSITTFNFWLTSLHTLWDTVAIFYRLNILRYYDRKK